LELSFSRQHEHVRSMNGLFTTYANAAFIAHQQTENLGFIGLFLRPKCWC